MSVEQIRSSMDEATIRRLNAINRQFYRVTADEFDQTRGSSWPGWERILPYLHAPLSVLDVGCGNGRFGVFLCEKLVVSHQSSVASRQSADESQRPPYSELGTRNSVLNPQHFISYHGLDSNAILLDHARSSLITRPGLEFCLEERDILEHPPDSGEYDLVVLFGVLHHIPGYEQRQQFVRGLTQRVKPGGLLAFASWRFFEYERFRQRIIPWPDDVQVEEHDYLLDWRRGEVSLRYCHYVDDVEHAALVAATGLTEILAYRADGQDGKTNGYSILRNVGHP